MGNGTSSKTSAEYRDDRDVPATGGGGGTSSSDRDVPATGGGGGGTDGAATGGGGVGTDGAATGGGGGDGEASHPRFPRYDIGQPGDGRSFESCLGKLIVPDDEASMLLFDPDLQMGCEPGVGRLTNPKAEKDMILRMIGMSEPQLTALAAVYLKDASRQYTGILEYDINELKESSTAWLCAVGKHLKGKEPTTDDLAFEQVFEKQRAYDKFGSSRSEVASALLQEVLATTAMCSAIAHALPRAEMDSEYLNIGSDKYRITGELTGGLGAVMLAERTSDNQKVIIKFPLEDNGFMPGVLNLDLKVISKLAETPVEFSKRNHDDETESIHYSYSEVLRANPGMKAEEIVRIMRLQWQQISMLSFFLEFIKTIVAHVRAPRNTAAPIAIGLAKHHKSEFPGKWALFSIQ